jgi:predicted ATPase
MVKKIVFDGGPGIGKTTLIRALEKEGYQIVDEAARFIINERQKTNPEYSPADDLQEFQECVVNMQWNWEDTAEMYAQTKGVDIACDRGLVSTIAYLRHADLKVPQGYIDDMHGKYDQVFIPDQLPSYINDVQRFESPEEAKKIHELHIKAYLDTGYNPIKVPVFDTPEERVQYVLGRLIK